MNKEIEKHFELLGKKATDKITGFKGIVSSLSFDLYGCIQVVITPATLDKDKKLQSGQWFDIVRVNVSKDQVLKSPDFLHETKKDVTVRTKKGGKGPSDKPNKY